MKISNYIIIGQAGFSVALAVALYLTFSSLTNTKVKLGKAKSDSEHNYTTALGWKKRFEDSESEKRAMTMENNLFVQSLVDANLKSSDAASKMAVEGKHRNGVIEHAISNFVGTEVAITCENRVANIDRTLGKYLETAE